VRADVRLCGGAWLRVNLPPEAGLVFLRRFELMERGNLIANAVRCLFQAILS